MSGEGDGRRGTDGAGGGTNSSGHSAGRQQRRLSNSCPLLLPRFSRAHVESQEEGHSHPQANEPSERVSASQRRPCSRSAAAATAAAAAAAPQRRQEATDATDAVRRIHHTSSVIDSAAEGRNSDSKGNGIWSQTKRDASAGSLSLSSSVNSRRSGVDFDAKLNYIR